MFLVWCYGQMRWADMVTACALIRQLTGGSRPPRTESDKTLISMSEKSLDGCSPTQN
jgi:hypothetical protein